MFNFLKKKQKKEVNNRLTCIICNRRLIEPKMDHICGRCYKQFEDKSIIVNIKDTSNVEFIREINEYEKNNLFRCNDGHFVKSKGEKIIDETLEKFNYLHTYEKIIKTDKAKKGYITADFYMPKEDIYIEYWGKTNSGYLEQKNFKLKMYSEMKLTVIGIIDKDIKNLEKILIDKIKNHEKNKLNYCDIEILHKE